MLKKLKTQKVWTLRNLNKVWLMQMIEKTLERLKANATSTVGTQKKTIKQKDLRITT